MFWTKIFNIVINNQFFVQKKKKKKNLTIHLKKSLLDMFSKWLRYTLYSFNMAFVAQIA